MVYLIEMVGTAVSSFRVGREELRALLDGGAKMHIWELARYHQPNPLYVTTFSKGGWMVTDTYNNVKEI